MPYKNLIDKRKYMREYYSKNRANLLHYAEDYRNAHKEKIKKDNKKYHEKNKIILNKKHKKYLTIRLTNDLSFKIACELRNRLRQSIKKNWKSGSSVKDLGCTVKFLKHYIEVQFHDDMSWDNWGKVWELDHIIPLWKFDLTDRKQFLVACNYKNLQPLTVTEHRKKTAQENKERTKLRTRI